MFRYQDGRVSPCTGTRPFLPLRGDCGRQLALNIQERLIFLKLPSATTHFAGRKIRLKNRHYRLPQVQSGTGLSQTEELIVGLVT